MGQTVVECGELELGGLPRPVMVERKSHGVGHVQHQMDQTALTGNVSRR